MRALIALFLTAALAFGSQNAHADFAAELAARFPAVAGAKVEPAFPGFYSVVKGDEVLFVRDDLSVLVTGDVIDLRTNRSLSAQLKAANPRRVATGDLRLEDSITIGTGTRVLHVFADPDCGYCKQLQRELLKVKNVKVHLFPFPLAGLQANGPSVSESIWCQPDRAAAWQGYVLERKVPPLKTCANPLARNIKFAEANQIRGTPALIFADGTVIAGALPAERIEGLLSSTSTK